MSFRDDFFAARPAPAVERVETAAGTAIVHAMTAAEKDRFDREHVKARGQRFRARLIVATARDEKGEPLFGREDMEALDGLPVAYLEPLVEAAIRVNRMSDAEQAELEKN